MFNSFEKVGESQPRTAAGENIGKPKGLYVFYPLGIFIDIVCLSGCYFIGSSLKVYIYG